MSLRFRQVHLDFHTSGEIPGVGSAFDKREFQRTLTEAAVDSITCFSVCHHGYSYYPTQIGQMHPSLKFDLLRAQIDAAHEVDIRVPVYLSAGGNEAAATAHPEWREVLPPDVTSWGAAGPLKPGFHKLCFNTPYLDYLCRLTEETATLFPDADGFFFDIILQGQCCCPACLKGMQNAGLDPEDPADRCRFADQVLEHYYQRITAAVRNHHPAMPIFHNSGHVSPGRIDRLRYFSHLELESLPTGGWGYDHFLQSAAFARKTSLEFLGMTGKFHSSWGEFGGLKHPNALCYECAAMMASGAKCSIGDQLHPSGKLDASTYEIIGRAYREVREKEPFCRGAQNVADIAVISAEAFRLPEREADTGIGRLLTESHFLFDVLHPEMDLSPYRAVMVADELPLTGAFAEKLTAYRQRGGKVILSGASGLNCPFDLGGSVGQKSEFNPTYLLPAPPYRPEFCSTPFVMYGSPMNLQVTTGKSLGDIYDPYFNRTLAHFCSHQHCPNRPTPNGFAGGILTANTLYFAHPVFKLYYQAGAVVLREFLAAVLTEFLGDAVTVRSNLPSLARLTVTRQEREKRTLIHLLYGNMVKRGNGVPGTWLGDKIEVIEELLPLPETKLELHVSAPVKRVSLQPQDVELAFAVHGNWLAITAPSFACHQIIAVE
ncbi:MAG: alpha-amylase family protein [Lentisphaeria bacterium]